MTEVRKVKKFTLVVDYEVEVGVGGYKPTLKDERAFMSHIQAVMPDGVEVTRTHVVSRKGVSA